MRVFVAGQEKVLAPPAVAEGQVLCYSGGGVTGGEPKLDDLAAPDDNTDLNASTTAHGLLRKLDGSTGNFLRGDGAWAAPPAGGSPPTGTGFRHVTGGAEDAASKLVDTADINNDQVTYAKMQNVSATDRLLGRSTAGAGDVEEIVCTASGRALLDDASAADQRTTLGLGALATKATVATADIDADAVTYAKIQNVTATDRFLGRKTAGAGDVEELTGTEATARLDAFTSTLKGLAPSSGGGTSNFLRADGTWAAPSGATNPLTKGAGTSIAAGADITWLVLSANSSDITGTTLTTVMTITGVGVGRYHWKCQLVYQTTATTTGIDVAATHTGTTTRWMCEHRQATTGGAAATAAATGAGASATGNLYEAQGNRTKNAIIGAGSVSVDAANTDMLSTIEGYFVVSVSGDLQIKLAAESAGLVVRAIEGSFLELKKLS